MKALTILPVAVLMFGNGVNSDTSIGGLSDLPVKYEMHIGKLDLNCYGGNKDYDDDFDSKPIVFDAEVSLSYELAERFDSQKSLTGFFVKTGVNWIGFIDKDSLDIQFNTQRAIDITSGIFKKYDIPINVLSVESVNAKMVQNTIHGTLSKTIVFSPLTDLVKCSGETTLLMLPK